jgi:hypothetical protein
VGIRDSDAKAYEIDGKVVVHHGSTGPYPDSLVNYLAALFPMVTDKDRVIGNNSVVWMQFSQGAHLQ